MRYRDCSVTTDLTQNICFGSTARGSVARLRLLWGRAGTSSGGPAYPRWGPAHRGEHGQAAKFSEE